MGISHITFNLRPWNQSCNRVHDHNIHSAGAYHGLCNLQSLLTVIRLGNIKIVHIHTDMSGIYRVQSVLRINKACDSAPLLHLCHHMQRHCGLTTGFRSVDFHYSSSGDSAQSQGNIKAQGACWYSLHIHM